VAVTIKEVAEVAGVSVATVSRVLSGKSGAGEGTVERIKKISQELGYRPSRVAQSLVTRRTGNIGIISPRKGNIVFGNPFFSTILEGVSDVLDKVDYNIVLSFTPSQQKRLLETRSVDGLILFAMRVGDPVLEWVRLSGLPTVVVGSYLDDSPYPCVRPDDESGVYAAVRYLAQKGHSRITLVTGPLASVKSVRCRAGYLKGMREEGLNIEPGWVIEAEEYDVAASFEALDARFRAGTFSSTAMVCASDYLALGLLKAARVNKIDIPDDLSLIGFGDVPISEFLHPALTTMSVDLVEMGVQAARMLTGLVQAKEIEQTEMVFPVTLVERQSVCPPVANALWNNPSVDSSKGRL
jgi:LacI family transcriptional regulator